MRVLSDEKIETIANEVGAPTSRYFPYWRTTVDLCRAIEDAVLEAQGKQEPVAWLARGIHGGKVIAAKLHDYKQDADNTASVFIEHYGAAETVPLYAAPVVQEKQEPVALMYEDVTAAGKPTGVYLLADKSFRTDPDVFPVFRAPVVQPDMVMVPREPTEAMLDAPEVRIDAPCFGCGDTAVTWGQLAEIYRAMVAAAEKEG